MNQHEIKSRVMSSEEAAAWLTGRRIENRRAVTIGAMVGVTLTSADGGRVAELAMPSFLPGKHPDMIVWGERVFVPLNVPTVEGQLTTRATYREGFAWVAVPESDITHAG